MIKDSFPLVSVRCLAYNQAKYIRKCLDGFVSQRADFPFEVIIHDDASTDGTAEIISEYAKKYPKIIKPILQEENQYRKFGFKKIREEMDSLLLGKYIAFCEGDDYWSNPKKLQIQVDFMEKHPECGLCYTDFDIESEETDEITSSAIQSGKIIPPIDFEDHLQRRCYIGPMSWLYRRDVYETIKNFGNHSDGSYALALDFFAISKVMYLPVNTAVYRVHSGSACHQDDANKLYIYKKGVYDTQYQYACRYLSQEKADYLKLNAYMVLLPLAIEIDNKEYLLEAQAFFESKNMDYKAFYGLCIDRYSLMNSKSLKLGNTLLKPVRKLFNRVNK